jgi:hypothetical protein
VPEPAVKATSRYPFPVEILEIVGAPRVANAGVNPVSRKRETSPTVNFLLKFTSGYLGLALRAMRW